MFVFCMIKIRKQLMRGGMAIEIFLRLKETNYLGLVEDNIKKDKSAIPKYSIAVYSDYMLTVLKHIRQSSKMRYHQNSTCS